MNAPRFVRAEVLAVLNDAEKAELVAHNEFGEARCGWKPAGES